MPRSGAPTLPRGPPLASRAGCRAAPLSPLTPPPRGLPRCDGAAPLPPPARAAAMPRGAPLRSPPGCRDATEQRRWPPRRGCRDADGRCRVPLPRGWAVRARASGTCEWRDPGTCCSPCPSLRDTWRRRFAVPWVTNDWPPRHSGPFAASEGTAPRSANRRARCPRLRGVRARWEPLPRSVETVRRPSGDEGSAVPPAPALGLLAARSRTGTLASCPFREEMEGVGRGDESERQRAESQWIVAARPLCHLQYPVAYLSRLQRILPVAR